MTDFLAAIGLVFAIEGLLFAAFPGATRRAMETAAETPEHHLRITGLIAALLGVAIVYIVRRWL